MKAIVSLAVRLPEVTAVSSASDAVTSVPVITGASSVPVMVTVIDRVVSSPPASSVTVTG